MKKVFLFIAAMMTATVMNLQAANVYFKLTSATSWWPNDGAKIGALFKVGTDPLDFGMYAQFFTLVPGTTDTYVGTVPENEEPFVAVQFLRYNSAATNPEEMNYWNATGLETWDGVNDMFTATGSGDTWDSTTGKWSKYGPAGSAKIVVVYDLQGHGEAIKNDTIESGSKITQPADPEAEGYDFRGWYSNAKGLGEAFDFNQTVTADKDTTITIYAKWRDPAAWEQFKKDLDAYSYVEYDSTYEAGFMIHLATTQDAQVQPLKDAAYIEASEEVLANYDFRTFTTTIVSLYPAASDELGKCAGEEPESPIRRRPVQNVFLKLISAYTQLPYHVNGLNAVCGLYSSYVDLVYKAWLETNYEKDAERCTCMFNSDVFFKATAKLREAFDVCEK